VLVAALKSFIAQAQNAFSIKIKDSNPDEQNAMERSYQQAAAKLKPHVNSGLPKFSSQF
jgi:hypothetical protein